MGTILPQFVKGNGLAGVWHRARPSAVFHRGEEGGTFPGVSILIPRDRTCQVTKPFSGDSSGFPPTNVIDGDPDTVHGLPATGVDAP